jgi:hypothetical protein
LRAVNLLELVDAVSVEIETARAGEGEVGEEDGQALAMALKRRRTLRHFQLLQKLWGSCLSPGIGVRPRGQKVCFWKYLVYERRDVFELLAVVVERCVLPHVVAETAMVADGDEATVRAARVRVMRQQPIWQIIRCQRGRPKMLKIVHYKP